MKFPAERELHADGPETRTPRRRRRFAPCALPSACSDPSPSAKSCFLPAPRRAKGRVSVAPITPFHWRNRVIAPCSSTRICGARPSTKFFISSRRIGGITDYLVGRADIQAAKQATEVENLHVMPGGQKAPNPAELLSGQSFAALVSDAARSYDRVVIDSAPVMAVSDTLLMTPYVQSVCLVVHARRTARNMVQRADRHAGAGREPACRIGVESLCLARAASTTIIITRSTGTVTACMARTSGSGR